MNRVASDNLDWLAFRYLAGELDATETVAFENRLAGDLAAAEAVARAVELTQAVALACDTNKNPSQPTPATFCRPRSGWSRVIRATVAFAAAAACAAAILLGLRDKEPRRPAVPAREAAASPAADEHIGDSVTPIERVALAWSEIGESLAALGVEDWLIDANASADYELPAVVAVDEDESELAPSWMLAAVADLSPASDAGLPTGPAYEKR